MAHRIRTVLLTVFISFLVAAAIGEVVLRIATRTARNGMLAIGNVPLLPYRLDADKSGKWLTESRDSSYIVHDEYLGWSIRPDFRDSLYETNSEEIRASRDRVYGSTPAKGKVRVLAFGDSFTHCDDVTNDQTWEVWLERMRGDLEVVNLGVPAYGTDQAYLRWRQKGASLGPKIVILGILPENMCRNLGIIRYYLDPTGDLISKPRFVFSSDQLELVNCPVMSSPELIAALSNPDSAPILKHEYWFRSRETSDESYYVSRFARTVASIYALYKRRELRSRLYSGEDASGIKLTVAIAGRFSQEVRAKGATPVILVIPMRVVLDLYPEENSSPLVMALHHQNLNVVDPGPRIITEGFKELIPGKGHFSGAGNKLLATDLENSLKPWIDSVLAGTRSARRGGTPLTPGPTESIP